MESYIEKINNKILKKCKPEQAKRVKKIYLAVGGTFLGVGIAGFLGCFIAFMVLFFQFETDRALISWFIAIPFIILIVAGSVITRIGDMLLTQKGEICYHKAMLKKEVIEEAKRIKKVNHLNKKIAKLKAKTGNNNENGGQK